MKEVKFYEKTGRSLAKSISFRIIVVISDIIIVYSLTHRYDFTIGAVILTNLSSSVLYFLHERVWNNIHWGKQKG